MDTRGMKILDTSFAFLFGLHTKYHTKPGVPTSQDGAVLGSRMGVHYNGGFCIS